VAVCFGTCSTRELSIQNGVVPDKARLLAHFSRVGSKMVRKNDIVDDPRSAVGVPPSAWMSSILPCYAIHCTAMHVRVRMNQINRRSVLPYYRASAKSSDCAYRHLCTTIAQDLTATENTIIDSNTCNRFAALTVLAPCYTIMYAVSSRSMRKVCLRESDCKGQRMRVSQHIQKRYSFT
jgi:hypothetical protein